MTTQQIILGQRYRDSLSGIEGVATAKTTYLYGCVQVCLEYVVNDEIKLIWLDEQRIGSIVPEQAIEPTATSGGSLPTPPSRGH